MAMVCRNRIYRAVSGLVLASVGLTSGVKIAVYDTDGNNGNGTLTAKATADTLTASDLDRGGVTAFARANSFAAEGWTTGAALNLNQYFEFTLRPASGYSFSLGKLIFGEQQVDIQGQHADDPLQWAVRTSLDGYTANLASGATTPVGSGVGTQTIDLSNLGTITSAVTFRIYGYNCSNHGGQNAHKWALVNYGTDTGVTVIGEVVHAPEPGAGLCLALGGAGLLFRRRSRHRGRRGPTASRPDATPAAA